MEFPHLVAAALLAAVHFTSHAQNFAFYPQWQVHAGSQIKHSSHDNNIKKALDKAVVPPHESPGWRSHPVGPSGLSFMQHSAVKSNKEYVHFTYFRTIVDFGPNEPRNIHFKFDGVDDAVRLQIHTHVRDYNFSPKNVKDVDITAALSPGFNEIYVIHADYHNPGSSLTNMRIEGLPSSMAAAPSVAEEQREVAQAPRPAVIEAPAPQPAAAMPRGPMFMGAGPIPDEPVLRTPWQIHHGNGPKLIDFDTRKRENLAAAHGQANIPSPQDPGWQPATTRPQDGAVTFKKGSEIQKPAGQLDFTYFQTVVSLPEEGVEGMRVEIDIVDDSARVYLFNANHPGGYTDPAADSNAQKRKGIKVDLSNQMAPGNNRIAVVQFDQHRPGNQLWGMRLKLE